MRKYARYKGLPLRYAGGKSLAVGHILERIPPKITRLVSPFIGGGAVEVACAKERGMEVIAFDIFDILTNYWQVQIANPSGLAKEIRKWKGNKDTYKEVKENLRKHWKGEDVIRDSLKLAAHYWYNHNLSYGPGFLGWMSSIYTEQARVDRLIDKVERFCCPNLSVETGDFADVIPQYPGDFLYCDPPYYLDGDSKVFKGIYPQRNFPIHHKGFNHRKLCELLLSRKGGFVLSYNDCQTIREWYKEVAIYKVAWQYTLGQGETRIGKNRAESGSTHVKRSHELLIVKAS